MASTAALAFCLALLQGSDPAPPSDVRREAMELNEKAIALKNAGKTKEAIGVFEKALELAPGDETLAKNLGAAWNDEAVRRLEKDKDLDGAIRAFESASKHLRDDATLKRNRAVAHDRRGHERLGQRKYDDAMSDFRSAAQLDPKSGRYATSIALVHFSREQLDDAEEQLERVTADFPKEVDAWALLGETRYRKGDMERAVQAYEKAAQLDPKRAGLKEALERARQEAVVERGLEPGNSRNFQFHFPPGHKAVAAATDAVASVLEDAYLRVGDEFGLRPEGRTQVIFYEVKDFNAVTRADEWVGALYDGKIRIPLRDFGRQRDALRKTVMHEYTHRVIHALTGNACPTWLNEGLAQWSEDPSVRDVDERLRDQHEKLLTAAELRAPFVGKLTGAKARVAYDQSLSMAAYLLEQRGRSDVNRYLRAIGGYETPKLAEAAAFEEEFRMSFDEFLARWRQATNLPEAR